MTSIQKSAHNHDHDHDHDHADNKTDDQSSKAPLI